MFMLSCVQLFATPGTAAHQVPLSMGTSRQEYWSGLLFPTPWLLVSMASPVAEHRLWSAWEAGAAAPGP